MDNGVLRRDKLMIKKKDFTEMIKTTSQQEKISSWSLVVIGLLLISTAVFFDPIGSSPESGVVDLGIVGTKWLLGILGGACVLGGAFFFFKRNKPVK